MGSRRVLVLLAVTGGVVAFVLVATGSLIAGTLAGLLVFGACLFAIRARVPEDPDRRRFLVTMGGLGLAAVALGTAASAPSSAVSRDPTLARRSRRCPPTSARSTSSW